MNERTKVLIEAAIFAALAMALSLIPVKLGSSFSISLGEIPLTLFALRRGWKPAVFAGFIWGLLHFALGQVEYLTPIQVIIEYPLAFTFAGFAGLIAPRFQTNLMHGDRHPAEQNIIVGTLIGCVARYFWHFLAGFIFWGAYALWGLGPVVFSLVLNGLSMLATAIVTIVVLEIIFVNYPKIFKP